MISENNDKIKVSLFGWEKTGKTILAAYLKDGFKSLDFEQYLPTIGANYEGEKIILYKGNLYNFDLNDCGGQIGFLSLEKIIMKDTQIFFIFFDYNDRRSLDFAKTILNERKNEQQVFVLVGAKYDLKINADKKDNIIHEEEVLELADEKKALFVHLSNLEKYSDGVNELLKKSINEYIKRRKMN